MGYAYPNSLIKLVHNNLTKNITLILIHHKQYCNTQSINTLFHKKIKSRN